MLPYFGAVNPDAFRQKSALLIAIKNDGGMKNFTRHNLYVASKLRCYTGKAQVSMRENGTL